MDVEILKLNERGAKVSAACWKQPAFHPCSSWKMFERTNLRKTMAKASFVVATSPPSMQAVSFCLGEVSSETPSLANGHAW
eukprot:3579589-Pyramimonas_sp.AAC.1